MIKGIKIKAMNQKISKLLVKCKPKHCPERAVFGRRGRGWG